jgi:DNA-binding MarR family transcriptional regulator
MRSIAPHVPEGPRADILECVSRVPGAHLRGIERMTKLPLGQVLYHLDRLERMGLVVSSKDAGFRRYYLVKDVGRTEKKYLAALRHQVPRRIVLTLLEAPGQAHKDLQGRLEVAGSTLSFHLERLLASGVLVRQKVGGAQQYVVADPSVARWELIYYRESFADGEVDRYVRRALAALPDAAPAPSVPAGLEDDPSALPVAVEVEDASGDEAAAIHS